MYRQLFNGTVNYGPLVTVVIPTKNREVMLLRALSSVVLQTYKNLDIVVVDDASDIEMENIIRGVFHDPRIRVLRVDVSIGGAAARNIGMRAANGQFLCLLDDDDYYFPNKIEVLLPVLESDEHIDMVFSKTLLLDEDTGNTIIPIRQNYRFNRFKNFKDMNVIHTNSTLFRRRILDVIEFDERLQKYQDMQFHLSASLMCNIAFVDRVLAVWTVQKRAGKITSMLTKDDVIRDYKSFSVVCSIFKNYFLNEGEIKRKYLLRLAYLALKMGSCKKAFFHLSEIYPAPVAAAVLNLFRVVLRVPRFLKLKVFL